jgi:hypothetical protein
MPRCYCDPRASWKPALRLIAAITQSNPAVVTTTFDHGYVSGTIVRLVIPTACGMTEADQLVGTIAVTGGATFTIDIDTTAFDAFIVPIAPLPSQNICSWVVPIGETAYQLNAAEVNVIP